KTLSSPSKRCRHALEILPLLMVLLQGWDSIMGEVADLRRVLFLDCPPDVLTERLLSRGLSSGRTDDNLETANRRLQTFVETTLPV
ncbi:unnamed protein product, partial [Scytosiphon promiscuus]